MTWHSLSVDETLENLKSSVAGLTAEEAARRLEEYGPNELAEKEKVSPWKIFLEQFKSFLIIILLFAVLLSGALGEVVDAIIIGVIVLFACGLGFIQEYRAERAMEMLKKMAAPLALVRRGGYETEIASRDLVPGDVVVLHTGDKVPADLRLLQGFNLRTDEAPLTGESTPVEKDEAVLQGDTVVAERKNMVYTGTAVVYGRGLGVVVETGMKTEFGKIASMLQEVEAAKTPLQINLDKMGRIIAIGALVLCFILAGIGVLRGHSILEMLIWGISLAVAAVPEALPAVVTIGLAIGVQRMVKRHALVRRLPVVETLGCTTVICSDKTGTLTQDQMTIRRVYVGGKVIEVTGGGYAPSGQFLIDGESVGTAKGSALEKLLVVGTLCNDTRLVHNEGQWDVQGDPTEGALVVAAGKAGLAQDNLNQEFPRVGEVPFTSERKRMTTVHLTPEGELACMKGAPEVVLDTCAYIYENGKESPLLSDRKEAVLVAAQDMAKDALRVLGVAYRPLADTMTYDESLEREMVFVGLAGMIDPPREEVKDAIRTCERAGIRTVMITGDHHLTAGAIATELGLLKGGKVLQGHELEEIDEATFDGMVQDVDAFARVSPAHKLTIVKAWQKKNHVVAMTGDGVNDAPALKQADIGIAMGITGTDVTKEAADMILTDDNFASIEAAVEEGRGIYGNIKKYLVYLLSCNLGEILLMAIAILFGPLLGLPPGVIPLLAIQILYVNLATDGLPAIALSVDPPEKDIMLQRPRPKGETIFTPTVIRYLIGAGVWTGVVSLGVFVWAVKDGRDFSEAQSLCFVTLILVQFFNAFNCRSERHSLFKVGVFSNKWLWAAVVWEFIILLFVLYVPFLQKAFRTFPFTGEDWVISGCAAATIFIMAELYKMVGGRWIEPARARQ